MAKSGPFQRLVLNDPSEQMLSIAKEKLKNYPGIEFTGFFAEEPGFSKHSFTQIICLNSFHYYVDQPEVLNRLRGLLKPGGTLWIQDWNRVGIFRLTNKLIRLFSPENINTRTLGEMKSMLNEAGFSIDEEDSWSFRWWNFFYIRASF